MLARLIPKSSQFYRCLTLISSRSHFANTNFAAPSPLIPKPNRFFSPQPPHLSFFSTKGNNGDDDSPTSTTDLWKMSSEADEDIDSVFSTDSGDLPGFDDGSGDVMGSGEGSKGDVFGGGDWKDLDTGGSDIFAAARDFGGGSGEGSKGDVFGGGDWKDLDTGGSDIFAAARDFGGGEEEPAAEDDEQWSFGAEGKEEPAADMFGGVEADDGEMGLDSLGDGLGLTVDKEEEKQLEAEGQALKAVLKGPDCAFGDLIAASGITDEMLDGLIALKDFEGIQGLPPLSELEEKRYEKNSKNTGRAAESESKKREEAAKARVRKVDEHGRAYGTGGRKASVARVWIQPGDGKFLVNGKEFDAYFPMLDHRAALLRPFSETKTLGMWDVNCTVKGGGYTGQVGAIRLGISRALQNWEPGFRPALKQAGFLTRDSRVVERKKPGKKKARKSEQWVKR